MSTHNKDIDGFKRVYKNSKERVFKTAMRYSDNNYHIAQEITQEVFLKLYKHFDTFDEDYLAAWLTTTTKNAVKNYMKKAGREILDENISLTADLHVADKSVEDIVIERVEDEETFKLSRRILDDLYEKNERWYDAMTMVYCMGKKQQDVADELGISIEVLHSVLYRAKKWVREHYNPEEDTL